MWIVKNELKGVLRFPGLELEIPPGEERDLDVLGRERVEASGQIRVALENEYLRTIRKSVMIDESQLEKIIDERVAGIKAKLVSEVNELYGG